MEIILKCKCGEKYSIYMPMARIQNQLSIPDGEFLERAKECDKEAIANGEVNDIKKSAAVCGMGFIDGSILEPYKCGCGATIDLDNLLKKRTKHSMPASAGTWEKRSECIFCGKKLKIEGNADCLDKNGEIIKGREAFYAICCNEEYLFLDNKDGVESFSLPESAYKRK